MWIPLNSGGWAGCVLAWAEYGGGGSLQLLGG